MRTFRQFCEGREKEKDIVNIAEDHVKRFRVSTIYDGFAERYETMVFDSYSEYSYVGLLQKYYADENQARAGHAEIVNMLASGMSIRQLKQLLHQK
jgi:hypothetical protein